MGETSADGRAYNIETWPPSPQSVGWRPSVHRQYPIVGAVHGLCFGIALLTMTSSASWYIAFYIAFDPHGHQQLDPLECGYIIAGAFGVCAGIGAFYARRKWPYFSAGMLLALVIYLPIYILTGIVLHMAENLGI